MPAAEASTAQEPAMIFEPAETAAKAKADGMLNAVLVLSVCACALWPGMLTHG